MNFGQKIDKLAAKIQDDEQDNIAKLFPKVEQYLDYQDAIKVLIKESIMRGMVLMGKEPIKAVPDVLEAIEDYQRELGLKVFE